MTKKERLILTAWTGVMMCNTEDYQKYAEKMLGRPVYPQELLLPEFKGKMKELVEAEFYKLVVKGF